MNANRFELPASAAVSRSLSMRVEMPRAWTSMLRRSGSITVLALFSGLAALGCGSDGDDSAAGTNAQGSGGSAGSGGAGGQHAGVGGSASTAALCDAVTPYCEALYACCADPPFGYTDVADCKTKFGDYCSTEVVPFVDAQVAAGSTALDPKALDGCIAKLDAMQSGGGACSAPPDLVFWYECLAAFRGQVPSGGTCPAQGDFPSFIDCKDGLCDGAKCVAFLGTGDACSSSSGAQCNLPAGEWCIDGTCRARGGVGAPCSPASSDDNLACASMSCGPSGMCVAPTPSGLCSQL